MSNANHHSIRRLYSGFRKLPVERISKLAADPTYRKPVSELLITNYTFGDSDPVMNGNQPPSAVSGSISRM